MRKRLYGIVWSLVILALVGCKPKVEHDEKTLLEPVPFEYNQTIKIKRNCCVAEFDFSYHNQQEPKKITLPIKSVVVNGTSSLGFLEALDERNTIIGVSNPHYIYDSQLVEEIEKGTIKNIGIQGSVDVEEIIKLNPDIFLSYSDPNMIKIHQKLEELGIPVILIDDFKENTPLAKAEWIKFFGILLQQEDKANAFFQQVENRYNQLKEKYSAQKDKPQVLVDIMYGDVWYLPGKHSFLAHFIQDAGGDYIFSDEESETLNFSFERVYQKAKDADVWINASNLQKLKELEAKNHNYTLFKAFTSGKIYSLTGNVKEEANNYFEEGIARPDLILNDMVNILYHADETLKFYKKLD